MKWAHWNYPVVVAIVLLSIVLAGSCAVPAPSEESPRTGEVEGDMEIKVTEKGTKYVVHPDKLVGGGPPPDGIPSIDNPKFVSPQEADQWIQDNELVLAIIYKGVKRVYPLQIMVWHEIVNDTIAGDPLLITY